MTILDVALTNRFNPSDFEKYIRQSGYELKGLMKNQIDDEDVSAIAQGYELYVASAATRQVEEAEKARVQAEEASRMQAEKRKALAAMLITSGFSFEGYRITKYSGYISGDDVIQVERGTNFLIGGGTNAGSALSESLVKIRRNALKELKEAAYDLGCNAVIGVDFDYITLEPETANITGGTTYMPYVFCVTANGNAVVIEKIEE